MRLGFATEIGIGMALCLVAAQAAAQTDQGAPTPEAAVAGGPAPEAPPSITCSPEEKERDPAVLWEAGVRYRMLGKDEQALACFERLHTLEPTARVLTQRALAEQALGRWVDAYLHLREALGQPGDPWIAERRGALEGAFDVISENVGQVELTFKPSVEGSEIRIEGRDPWQSPLSPIVLPVGQVRIEARAPGYQVTQRTLKVSSGTMNRAILELVPETVEAPSAPGPTGATSSPSVPTVTSSNSRLLWLLVSGVGVLTAGAAAIPWVLSADKVDDLDAECPDGICRRATYDKRLDQIETLDHWTTGLVIAGSAITLTGLIGYLVDSDSEATPASPPAVAIEASLQTLRVRGHF